MCRRQINSQTNTYDADIFFSDNTQKDFVVIDLLHGFFPSLPHENTQEDLHLYGAYLSCVTTSSSCSEWLILACTCVVFLERSRRRIFVCPAYARKYVQALIGSFQIKLSSLRRQVYAHVDHFGNNFVAN